MQKTLRRNAAKTTE